LNNSAVLLNYESCGFFINIFNQNLLEGWGAILIEIRWHGRGGQGGVVASRIAAKAAFYEGYYSQAFPFFGAERRGAPVTAFTRISKEEIKLRSQIYEPDIIVIMDPALVRSEDSWKGLKNGGIVVANSEKLEPMGRPSKIAIVNATRIALDLGLVSEGLPRPNTAMVGAFSKVTGLISLENVKKAILDVLGPRIAKVNIDATERAYNETKVIEL
jgi:2-oxoacid:acceptor oxidoreductase gamma subunit (pyruvate/2-ketoisovalerate family)